MSLQKLEEDLAKQHMNVMVQAATPSLRYTYRYWFLTEEECDSDVIVVRLPAHHNISHVRMAEGIVARHFPLYHLSSAGRELELHFTKRK